MEANGPWRETLKRLLETPPAMGVEVISTPIQQIVSETENFIRAKIAVVCDPDAFEQTARKNAELMSMLRVINDKLDRGELVEVVRCKDCTKRRTPECTLWYGTLGATEYYLSHGDDFYCREGERREG